MITLLDIEAAAKALPQDQKWTLLTWLAGQLHEQAAGSATEHSVLDIPTVSLGTMRRPISSEDDLLGEMLEDRR